MSTEKQTNKVEYEDQDNPENKPKMGRALLGLGVAVAMFMGAGKLASEGYLKDAQEQKNILTEIKNEAKAGKLFWKFQGDANESLLVVTESGKTYNFGNSDGINATTVEKIIREAKQGQEDKDLIEGK